MNRPAEMNLLAAKLLLPTQQMPKTFWEKLRSVFIAMPVEWEQHRHIYLYDDHPDSLSTLRSTIAYDAQDPDFPLDMNTGLELLRRIETPSQDVIDE